MATTVVLQTLEDGPRWAVIKAILHVDTADLAKTTIADPATLAGDPLTGLFAALAIAGATWSVSATGSMVLHLQWDATTPTDAYVFGNGNDHVDWMCVGGPIRSDAAAGKNGKLVAITTGFAAAGVLDATLILKLLKTSG